MRINSDEDDKIDKNWIMEIVKEFSFDPYCRKDADADSYLAESLLTQLTRISADP